MSYNSFGDFFTITTFGESHGKAVGVIIDGIPSNIEIDIENIKYHLARRRPGQSDITTPRKEKDSPIVLSGLYEGKTTGAPLTIIIENQDIQSKDYDSVANCYRPSHSDYSWEKRYTIRDHRGGGRSSGRETVARVIAGAIALQLLKQKGISVCAYTTQIGDIYVNSFDKSVIEKNSMRACDLEASLKMEELVKNVALKGDSVGGVIECRIDNMIAGIGDPIFEKIDANLAKAIFSIGAVKAFEIGLGFKAALQYGSTYNDSQTKTGYLSNNGGGIEGGVTNGNQIIFRAAIKPTPSISLPQKTLTTSNQECSIQIQGRHDPCICPRIVPVIEAMSAIVILNALMSYNASCLFKTK